MRQQVREALLDAFRRPGEMKIAVSNAGLPRSFDNFLTVSTYEEALFNLLDWVEAQNLLVRFLNTCHQDNPRNPKLQGVMTRLRALEGRFATLVPLNSDGHPMAFEEAETLVLRGASFEDVGVWLEALGKIRRRVCRIEPQPAIPGLRNTLAGYGTGFLVAPDVVMTNFHVVRPFWANPAAAERVRVRFDFELPMDGGSPFAGTAHELATAWPTEKPSDDPREHPWQCLSSPELDFALLRLRTAAGDDRAGSGSRGFLALTAREFQPSDPILILQHPDAEPLKLSFGSVVSPEPPSWVRYRVNTQGGSSGSPCLTQDLKLTAIHHFGSADRNRGVTQTAILDFLSARLKQLRALDLGLLLP